MKTPTLAFLRRRLRALGSGQALFGLLACAVVAGAVAGSSVVGTQAQSHHVALIDTTANAVNARVIVKFKAGANTLRMHAMSAVTAQAANVLQARAQALGERHGRTLATGRGVSDRSQVVTSLGVDSATLARELASDADVEYAEVDHRRSRQAVPNDPLYAPVAGTSPASGQWYLKAPTASAEGAAGTDLVSSIDVPSAWDVSTGAGVVVAVVDTGIRFDHPDLAGQTLPGYDMIAETVTSNDGDGRDPDASDPGDYVTQADLQDSTFSNCDVSNSSWHGTQTSGLIGAAANNGIGMAGVAYGAKLLPVRVLGKCFGYDSDIIAGMRWAAGLAVDGVPANTTPAKVINMSLGGSGDCTSSYSDAVSDIIAAGSVLVAAAGNDEGLAVDTPGNCPGVIAVAGLRHAGTKVGFSDIGSAVSIAAPAGNCVNTTITSATPCLYPMLSTSNSGAQAPVAGSAGATYTDGVNDYALGTSFSAPMVSGTVALMMSVNPSITPSQVLSVLKSTARPFPTTGGSAGISACKAPTGTAQDECYCTTSTCGAGMLDASAAVVAAAALTSTTNTDNLQAVIAASSALPSPGDTVTLSAASTQISSGRTIASYAWSITASGGIVSAFTGGSTGSTATVVPTADGSFTVQLTVTDDIGITSTTTSTVTVDSLSVGVTKSPSAPVAGQTVTVSASDLALGSGRTLASYGWAIVSDGGIVSTFSSGATSSSATLVPTAAGSFTVRLTVIDDLGKQATADSAVTVVTSSTTTTGSGSTSSTTSAGSSGGGGAMSWQWLAGLAFAVLALGRSRRRQPGR